MPEDATPDTAEVALPRTTARPWQTWLFAAPAVPAVVGAVLPWFAPTSSVLRGVRLSIPSAYCWQAGRIGFLAPLFVVVACVYVLGPRLGLFAADQARTWRRDGLIVGVAGVLAGVVLGLTWLLLPRSYSIGGVTWDSLAQYGFRFSRGPQPGYVVSIAAAAIAIGCGAWLAARGNDTSDGDPTDDDEAGIIE